MIWNQLMLDVECAGTTRSAAIMAIGAAFFDLHRYEIGPTFIIPVHVATSVAIGMQIEPGGFLFWLRQSNEARNGVAYNLVDIHTALDRFNAFCAENCRRQDVRAWGNSSAFDMSIMNFAYDKCGKEMPWGFGKESCFRTVRNMNAHVPYEPTKERGSTHHNALDDVVFQIEHLFKIRRFNLEHRPLVLPK